MKRDYLLYCILIISLLSNCIFIYTNLRVQKNIKEKENQFLQSFMNKEQNEINVENLRINPFEKVINSNGDTILLNTLIDNSNKLILLISDNSCGACIEESLLQLSNTLKNKFVDNIFVIGYYENKRSFFLLNRRFPFKYYLLRENSSLRNLALKGPAFFTLNDSFLIYSPFFPIQHYGFLTQHFLNQTIDKYCLNE
jgi:hypothetical protein